jgi:hypothetical protein
LSSTEVEDRKDCLLVFSILRELPSQGPASSSRLLVFSILRELPSQGAVPAKLVFFIGKLEARKDMLACLFYLKRAASSGTAEARVLYREARKDCLLVFSI